MWQAQNFVECLEPKQVKKHRETPGMEFLF